MYLRRQRYVSTALAMAAAAAIIALLQPSAAASAAVAAAAKANASTQLLAHNCYAFGRFSPGALCSHNVLRLLLLLLHRYHPLLHSLHPLWQRHPLAYGSCHQGFWQTVNTLALAKP